MSAPGLTFTETEHGPSVEGASASLLSSLLADLEIAMFDAGAPLAAKPGVSEREVREVLRGVGLAPSAELVVWFGWHDGSARDSQPGMSQYLPNLDMASLSDAAERYRVTVLDFTPLPPPEPEMLFFGAGPGWLRLGRSNIGLAVECTGNDTPRIRFAHEEFFDSPGCRALSLCTFVGWLLYGVRNGAYVWDPTVQRWEVDTSRFHPSQRAALFF